MLLEKFCLLVRPDLEDEMKFINVYMVHGCIGGIRSKIPKQKSVKRISLQ